MYDSLLCPNIPPPPPPPFLANCEIYTILYQSLSVYIACNAYNIVGIKIVP